MDAKADFIKKQNDMIKRMGDFLFKLEDKSLYRRFNSIADKSNNNDKNEEIFMLLTQAYILGSYDGYKECGEQTKKMLNV